MNKKLIIISVLLLLSFIGKTQVMDKYGLNIGLTSSNQTWNYKLIEVEDIKDFRTGVSILLAGEKNLGSWFSFRSELGYLQKGFKSDELSLPDGTTIGQNDYVLHDLALDLGFKFKPLKSKINPYAYFGLRGDYMFSYNEVVSFENGNTRSDITSDIESFNKFNVGWLLAFGVEFNGIIYLEFDYNPTITSSLDVDWGVIKDNFSSLKLGVNINKFWK